MSAPRRLPRPPLARLGYADGARLVRGDLEEARDYEPRLLGLHVRGAHGGWGVARGLRVTLEPGARAVRVSPGTAFDCHGIALYLPRETILSTPEPTPGPATLAGGVFDLVLERPRATGAPGVHEANAGLAWRRVAGAGTSGTGTDTLGGADCGTTRRAAVPLARFRRAPTGTLTPIEAGVRPRLRARSRPHLVQGSVPGAALDWIVGSFDLRAWVDTSDAGFGDTPVYIASLEGWSSRSGVGAPFVRVHHEAPDGFQIHLLPASGSSFTGSLERFADFAYDTTVRWFGAEPHRECASVAPPQPPPYLVGVVNVTIPLYLATGDDE